MSTNSFLEKIKWIAYLYNKGYKKKEIANKFGIAPSTLSTYIGRAFSHGLLEEYFYIPLENLPYSSLFFHVRFEQRIRPDQCINASKPDIMYYQSIPSPHYLYIYLSAKNTDLSIVKPYCKIISEGVIEETRVLDISPTDNTLEIWKPRLSGPLDEIDELIMKTLFTLYNPPEYRLDLYGLTEYFSKYLPRNMFVYHYTRHVLRKNAVKRYIFVKDPWNSEHCLLYLVSNDLARLWSMVELLYNIGILQAVYTLFILSRDPAIVWINARCSRDKVSDPSIVHQPVKDSFYEIYFMEKLIP